MSPALAVDWQSENNDHRWQFRLRPGVHFHDGSPLTCGRGGDVSEHLVHRKLPVDRGSCSGLRGRFYQRLADAQFARVARERCSISLRSRAQPTGKRRRTPSAPDRFSCTGFNNGVLTLTANESAGRDGRLLDEITIAGNRPIRDQWLDLSVGRTDIAEVPPQELRQAQQQQLTVMVSPPVELLALAGFRHRRALESGAARGHCAAVDRGALSM